MLWKRPRPLRSRIQRIHIYSVLHSRHWGSDHSLRVGCNVVGGCECCIAKAASLSRNLLGTTSGYILPPYIPYLSCRWAHVCLTYVSWSAFLGTNSPFHGPQVHVSVTYNVSTTQYVSLCVSANNVHSYFARTTVRSKPSRRCFVFGVALALSNPLFQFQSVLFLPYDVVTNKYCRSDFTQ